MALTISNCSAEIATYFKIIFQITNMMSSATSAITTALHTAYFYYRVIIVVCHGLIPCLEVYILYFIPYILFESSIPKYQKLMFYVL